MEKARQHPALTAAAFALALAASVQPACAQEAEAAEPIPVPSGQTVTWIDTIHGAPGAEGLTIRFRFLAPEVAREGGSVTVDQALADMQVLCDEYALPRIAVGGPQPAQIVISLSDRFVEFGQPDPEATQLFEAYAITPDGCLWEAF